MPDTFIPGVGLTPFKIYSEYVIIFTLVITLIIYLKRLSRTGDSTLNYYLVAFVICIFSELSFTLYKSFYDTYNMMGHIYKILAYSMVYKGIFVSSIKKPYDDLRQNHNMLSLVINSIPQSLFWKDKNLVYLGCNQVFAELANVGSPDDIVGLSDFDLPWSDEESKHYRADDRSVMEEVKTKRHIIEHQRQADGSIKWLDTIKIPLTDTSGTVSGILGVFDDISWRKNAEREVIEASEKLKLILNSTGEGIYGIDLDNKCTFCNESALKMTGHENIEQLVGLDTHDMVHHSHADGSPFDVKSCRIFQALQKGIGSHADDEVFWKIDGTSFPVEYRSYPIVTNGKIVGSVVTFIDITERKRSETQNKELEKKLQQAQKMESVGRLAGGVAHDFNNMLTIIIGNAQLALMKTDTQNPLRQRLEEILNASERSAEITKQLLAFSRQQIVEPKVLDLNETIYGLLKMLRRLIGEDIELRWNPGSDLHRVKMDPSQLDQIMANLCVNARDAISGVGTISIATQNFTLDETGWDDQMEIPSGEYVMLLVNDSGSGIPKDVIGHIFEPFYTTKEVGKGTGLGLSTVFGIVKQNGGQIKVYSEPEHGTVFRIYFPAIVDFVEGDAEAEQVVVGGKETILVVEDEPAIIRIVTAMLSKLGYHVLTTNSPSEAIQLAKKNQGMIDLLLTDIIMPKINGLELSKLLLQYNPDMKRLFMSGYSADLMPGRGNVGNELHFIQKPFNLDSLSAKVRKTLDER